MGLRTCVRTAHGTGRSMNGRVWAVLQQLEEPLVGP